MIKLLTNLEKSLTNLLKSLITKNTQSFNAIANRDTLGDHSDTQILKNSELLGILFVENISRFPLIDFIECCVVGKFDSLIISGEPDGDQISENWIKILSQYYSARKDNSNNEKNEIIFRMQELKLRASIINMLLNSIGMIYSPSLIKTLIDFDEQFSQFSFDEGSIANDLQLVKNMEINNDIEYSQLKDDLEKLEKLTKDKNGEMVKSSESIFYDWVASYNEVFKTSFSVEQISTMTYANNCHRLDDYVKNLESQSNANINGNING